MSDDHHDDHGHGDDHGHDDHDDHGHDHGPDPYLVYPSAEVVRKKDSTLMAYLAFFGILIVLLVVVKAFA